MYRPRARTVRTASDKLNAPAATSAEYSPKLCPATNAGALTPASLNARNAATETVRIAGCVFSVNCKSSAGPSKQSREIAKPNASSASSKTRRATGNFSARSFPIPGACEPCPGKIIADFRLPIADLSDSTFPPLYDPTCQAQNRQSAIGNRKYHHHRINTAPQVTPPPNEAINTKSPSLIRP